MTQSLRMALSAPARRAQRGFTLIELLAVMLIISILAVFLVPQVPKWIDQANVTACRANLREIGMGVTSYRTKYGRLPSESGVRFFAELITAGVFENTVSAARKLTCPGVDIGALETKDMEPTEWFTDLDMLTGGYSSYAGRDCKNHPLRTLNGTHALVADDNDPEMNHDTTTLVLMGDNTVTSHELLDLRKKGLLGPEEILLVGPDSQIEELRKLSLD